MSAFANCGRAVAHVRGSYVPTAEVARLFDHLVGTTKQVDRQFEARRFRCPQVDHQSAPELAIHSASAPRPAPHAVVPQPRNQWAAGQPRDLAVLAVGPGARLIFRGVARAESDRGPAVGVWHQVI